MVMKSIIIVLIILSPIVLMGCIGKDPVKNDIIGKWVSKDGASLDFKDDGTFVGKSLPAEHFDFYVFSKKKTSGQKVSGAGKWKLEKGQGLSQIKLEFNEPNKGYHGLRVLISGSNLFENNPPWYLFYWINDEEGGDRYRFEKR